MHRVKCVVVGDSGVGKTSLLIRFDTDTFPTEYIPKLFDNYSGPNFPRDNIQLSLWDTVCGEGDYDINNMERLRPLCYPQTDIFLICYAVDEITSFMGIENKWIPELNYHIPHVPFILVGTKNDLRPNMNYCVLSEFEESARQNVIDWFIRKYYVMTISIISMEFPNAISRMIHQFVYCAPSNSLVDINEIEKVAERCGAVAWAECSALTGGSVNEIFEMAKKYGLEYQRKNTSKGSSTCKSKCLVL